MCVHFIHLYSVKFAIYIEVRERIIYSRFLTVAKKILSIQKLKSSTSLFSLSSHLYQIVRDEVHRDLLLGLRRLSALPVHDDLRRVNHDLLARLTRPHDLTLLHLDDLLNDLRRFLDGPALLLLCPLPVLAVLVDDPEVGGEPTGGDEDLAAEAAVVVAAVSVVVPLLLVIDEVELLGGAVVALVAGERLLAGVRELVLGQLVLGAEAGAAVVADVGLDVAGLDVLVARDLAGELALAVLALVDLLLLLEMRLEEVDAEAVEGREAVVDGAALGGADVLLADLLPLGGADGEAVALGLVALERRLGERFSTFPVKEENIA